MSRVERAIGLAEKIRFHERELKKARAELGRLVKDEAQVRPVREKAPPKAPRTKRPSRVRPDTEVKDRLIALIRKEPRNLHQLAEHTDGVSKKRITGLLQQMSEEGIVFCETLRVPAGRGRRLQEIWFLEDVHPRSLETPLEERTTPLEGAAQ